jgi:transcription initiation factor TFIIIB Brf1 subunit/transcription initiation factor TFIIB
MFLLNNESIDTMQHEYNYKHISIVCPECKGTQVLVDPMHQETYCTKCGLILKDNSIFKITIELDQEQEKNIRLNRFWRTTNKKSRLQGELIE